MLTTMLAVAALAAAPNVPGFQDSRWGMQPAEVMKLFPGGRQIGGPGLMESQVDVAGAKKLANFSFDEGGLQTVSVTMVGAGKPEAMAAEFLRLLPLLSAKYGTPMLMDGSKDRPVAWKSAAEVTSALAAADMKTISASWMAGETMISLGLTPMMGVMVVYSDQNHAARVVNAKTKGL